MIQKSCSSINENKEGQVQIYTSGGKEITKNQFQHQALPNVNWVMNDQEFNPIFLKTTTKTEEINCFSSGKIQGLLELRDHDLPQILSSIDELAHNVSCEINKIHSRGNTFPGHTELTSLGDIEDKEFSGEIKIALLSEEGKPTSDENGYVIRPLTIDLARKKLPEIASEIEQHFTFGDNQIKIADYIDDVKLIPASEMGRNFTFNLELENSEHNSDIYMQAASIAYGNGLLLFFQDLSEEINAKPYQTIGTKTPITVNLKNLPSIAKDFTIKIKMNVSGSYAEIDYDLSLSEIKDYYSASYLLLKLLKKFPMTLTK